MRIPAWAWVALPALSLWPIWHWSARRMTDGSDDPLGVLALIALIGLVFGARRQLAQAPRLRWMLVSLALAGLAVTIGSLPILVCAVIAVLAMVCAVLAVRDSSQPVLAWLGLGLLALPVISSLQFFVGYPLRVVTAEVTAWVLGVFGVEAMREGSTLAVSGQLIMVDAPCSGIQMAWIGYFTACLAAGWLRMRDGVFLRRAAGVGAVVLTGNIVRNTVLVALEAQGRVPQWAHEAVGILVFIGVCAGVLCLMMRRLTGPASRAPVLPAAVRASSLMPAVAAGFAVLAVVPLLTSEPLQASTPISQPEWPDHYEGERLRPLALSDVERRFAAQFPGAIARFTDERRVITLRQVNAPTRKLHPAADCFRGLGYRVSDIALSHRESGQGSSGRQPAQLQRCFVATRQERSFRVCEVIEDAAGRGFTDTSAWYWAALSGESQGPWLAVTTVSPMLGVVASR